MHCQVTAILSIACYVSNFPTVSDAETYEASGQTGFAPIATVAMEYNPASGPNAVQFWAYKSDGTYLQTPSLDSQGPKPIPEICLACHQGNYTDQAGATVTGAAFLPFDMDSFLDAANTPLPKSAEVNAAVQYQFHLLNDLVLHTNPPPGVTQLINLWYSGPDAIVPFRFGYGAAQLPGQPFLVEPGDIHHEPLYDNVVKLVCRTCHVPQSGAELNSFNQMLGLGSLIRSLTCAPTLTMPHAEVPWTAFWAASLSSTLVSELGDEAFPAGCPPN
jgi:hypothetical protein